MSFLNRPVVPPKPSEDDFDDARYFWRDQRERRIRRKQNFLVALLVLMLAVCILSLWRGEIDHEHSSKVEQQMRECKKNDQIAFVNDFHDTVTCADHVK